MSEVSPDYKVAIVGNGYVGKAYYKVFPEAVVHDEPHIEARYPSKEEARIEIEAGRLAVNACDMTIVCVPTNPKENGELDMGIVEEVVGWIDTPLILIKSALQPGTTDRLVEKTGKKIAVSVEMVGEGKYYLPDHKYPDPENPIKHDFLIIGGEEETATQCAEFFWRKMSPDIKIHILKAREAEMVKLIENSWGAMKVTWANTLFDYIEKSGGNFIKVHQAWTADTRVDAMHTRVISRKRGWSSRCWDKDIPALEASAANVGAVGLKKLLQLIQELNIMHINGSDAHAGEESPNR